MRNIPISRREALGTLAAAPTLPTFMQQILAGVSDARSKTMSIILLYLNGGADHKSLFTPDSKAVPSEYRGPFNSIQTTVPGIHFAETLQKTAKHADRMAILRSIETGSTSHITSPENQLLQNGGPTLGSIWGKKTAKAGQLPYAFIPSVGDGFVTKAHRADTALVFSWFDEFNVLESDTYFSGGSDGSVLLDDLQGYYRSPLSTLNTDQRMRFEDRLQLSKNLSRAHTPFAHNDAKSYQQSDHVAKSLLLGRGKLAHALNPRSQKRSNERRQEILDRLRRQKDFDKRLAQYGGNNYIAQSLLLAARLVEADARVVTVNHSHFHTFTVSWDHHSSLHQNIKDAALPLDAAIAALISDIRTQRIPNTLLAIVTDFDRTPKINSRAGRDHWDTGTLILVSPEGHGISGGSTYGKKTYTGEITEHPLIAKNGDVTRTILHAAADGRHDEFLTPNNNRARSIMMHPY